MLKKEIPMLKVVSFHHIIRFEYPGHPADYIVNFYIILDLLIFVHSQGFGYSIIMSFVDFSLNRIQKVHTALTM